MKAPSASRTAIANAVSYAIAIAISFVQAPFLIHQLGDERYGIWTLIGLVTGYYGLLDLGTRGAVGFFVARARAQEAEMEIAEITASAFWFLAAAGAVVLVIGTGVLFAFPNLFRVAAEFRAESFVALGIALALTVLTLPLDVFAAIVNGCRRGEVITFTETIVRILVFVLIFVLFQHGARLDVLAGIQVVGKAIVWVVAFITARRLEPHWSVSFRFWRRSRLAEITRYGLQTFVINVASVIVERVDAVVIAVMLGARMVTFYVIGQSLVSYMTQGVYSVTLALTPFFADLHAKDDAEQTRWLFFAGTRAASVFTGLLTGGLIAFGSPFLARWVGPQYVAGAWFNRSDTVLYILLVAMVPRLVHSAAHQYFFGSNKQGFFAKILIGEGLANLVLSLALVKPFGLAGVAIGTALPSLVSQAWYVPHYVMQEMGVPRRRLFIDGQARGLFIGLAVAALGELAVRLIPPTSWTNFFVGVIATVLLSMPVIWYAGIDTEDRDLAKAVVARLRPVRDAA